MKYDARQLSTDEQVLLRRLAEQRIFDGESAVEVIRSYDLGARTICTWLIVAREKGIDALAPKPRPGRVLSDFETEEIKPWVLGGDPFRSYCSW